MTSKDLLERIAKLIALASSPNIEEARSAAHKACSMMREHGVVLAIEEGETFITRETRVKAPDRPTRRTPERRTVIVFRCARCGRPVERQGTRCQACEQLNVPLGVWTVTCQGCGRSTPPGYTEMEVNQIALQMGFIVTDDGITLCPTCQRQRGHRRTG